MAIEFNGKGKNIQDLRIQKGLPNHKEVAKEETIKEQAPVIDNKFVKEMGEDLLASNAATAFGINFNKTAGTKIDKEFWGDALNGLKLKETVVSADTTKKIVELGDMFAMVDMENKMASSTFMKALNKEFNI